MPTVCRLRIESLVDEAFRPFGELIDAKERPPDHRQFYPLNFQGGTMRVSAIWEPFQGFAFSKMERHFHVTQAFIPLDGPPAVVAVAAPTDANDLQAIPRAEQVRAFLIDGAKGYLMKKGTWHSLTRFVLQPPGATYVELTDEETTQDARAAIEKRGESRLTQQVDYMARFGVTFEITMERH